MKAICQNIVKKDSLYPLIKHHVPLWNGPIFLRRKNMYAQCLCQQFSGKVLGVFFCDSLDLCYDACHVIKHES